MSGLGLQSNTQLVSLLSHYTMAALPMLCATSLLTLRLIQPVLDNTFLDGVLHLILICNLAVKVTVILWVSRCAKLLNQC